MEDVGAERTEPLITIIMTNTADKVNLLENPGPVLDAEGQSRTQLYWNLITTI